MSKRPSSEVLDVVERLCGDPRNTVMVVSGRGRQALLDWFASCPSLGLAAEHGYFYR